MADFERDVSGGLADDLQGANHGVVGFVVRLECFEVELIDEALSFADFLEDVVPKVPIFAQTASYGHDLGENAPADMGLE